MFAPFDTHLEIQIHKKLRRKGGGLQTEAGGTAPNIKVCTEITLPHLFLSGRPTLQRLNF